MLLWWIRREKAHFPIFLFYILCGGSFSKVRENWRRNSECLFQPVLRTSDLVLYKAKKMINL